MVSIYCANYTGYQHWSVNGNIVGSYMVIFKYSINKIILDTISDGHINISYIIDRRYIKHISTIYIDG